LIALMTALTAKTPLKGAIVLSSYLPNLPAVYEDQSLPLGLPVFIGHGVQDDIVPLVLGEGMRDLLKNKGANVMWRAYPMAHQVCEAEFLAIGQFLNNLWQ
jgi:phospholipase/carboxylesterase